MSDLTFHSDTENSLAIEGLNNLLSLCLEDDQDQDSTQAFLEQLASYYSIEMIYVETNSDKKGLAIIDHENKTITAHVILGITAFEIHPTKFAIVTANDLNIMEIDNYEINPFNVKTVSAGVNNVFIIKTDKTLQTTCRFFTNQKTDKDYEMSYEYKLNAPHPEFATCCNQKVIKANKSDDNTSKHFTPCAFEDSLQSKCVYFEPEQLIENCSIVARTKTNEVVLSVKLFFIRVGLGEMYWKIPSELNSTTHDLDELVIKRNNDFYIKNSDVAVIYDALTKLIRNDEQYSEVVFIDFIESVDDPLEKYTNYVKCS